MDWSRVREAMRGGAADPFVAARYYKKDSAAPDYTPMANASAEAAQIGAQLGREQMAQGQAQFEREMAVAQPVIDAQLGLMNQQKAQGDDYFNYMVSRQRPVEDALNQESMTNPTAAQDAADRALITGGDTGVYEARKQDIEDSVGRVVADARGGQSANTSMLMREGIRLGWSPEKIAQIAASQGVSQASAVASAANATRGEGIDKARGLLAQNYGMRKQDEATSWAKKMDVAGLYRGLTGASQGAYSLATNAGNSAVGNAMQPGNQILGNQSSANNTTMSGQQMAISGLGSILNSQTSVYNAKNQNSVHALGTVLGVAGSLFASDRRMKENIIRIGEYPNGLPKYEFNYIGIPQRYIGVMAQDVIDEFPEAVVRIDGDMMAVRYDILGISMEKAV